MVSSREMSPVTVYCDGGCSPNPGSMETIIEVGGTIHYVDVGVVGGNNQAELRAALAALDEIERQDLRGVILLTDSAHVRDALAGVTSLTKPLLTNLVAQCLAHPAMARVSKTIWVDREENLAGMKMKQYRKAARTKQNLAVI